MFPFKTSTDRWRIATSLGPVRSLRGPDRPLHWLTLLVLVDVITLFVAVFVYLPIRGSNARVASRMAETAETEERWRDAEAHYDSILKVFPTRRSAQEGKARTRARAEFEERLDAYLREPEGLKEASALMEAWSLLESQENRFHPPDSRLAQHLDTLCQHLEAIYFVEPGKQPSPFIMLLCEEDTQP